MKSRRRKSSARTTKRLIARSFPIIEYDPSPTAIIEPRRVYKRIDIPKHCVLCFFQDVIDDLVLNGGAREIDHDFSEVGRHPMYEVEIDGKRLAVVHPRVGAAIAAAMFDRLIARGARKFIACGGAGVLDSKIAVGEGSNSRIGKGRASRRFVVRADNLRRRDFIFCVIQSSGTGFSLWSSARICMGQKITG